MVRAKIFEHLPVSRSPTILPLKEYSLDPGPSIDPLEYLSFPRLPLLPLPLADLQTLYPCLPLMGTLYVLWLPGGVCGPAADPATGCFQLVA